MNLFNNLKTKVKLLLSFSVICGLLLFLDIFAFYTLAGIQKHELEILDHNREAEFNSAIILSDCNSIRASMLELIITPDTAKRELLTQKITDSSRDINWGIEYIKAYGKEHEFSNVLTMTNDLEEYLSSYNEGCKEMFRLLGEGRKDEAIVMAVGIQGQRFEQIRAVLLSIKESIEKKVETALTVAQQMFVQAISVFIIIAVIALLFSIFIVRLLNRQFIAPLQILTKITGNIAAGNLITQVKVDNRVDEIGQLQTAIETMVHNLQNLNQELKNGFNVLASSSAEIVSTVSQVTASSTETAAAVSETSATAEEVKQTAHLSAQKAKAVQESAQKAGISSEAGRKAVNQAIEGMDRIRLQMDLITESVVRLSEQSQTIGEIITSVNDLAEQSNLLAVNASIEATRAGEYGKSFAVVAQEVKSLAEQSKQATKQVRSILMEVQKATSAAVMAAEQGSKAVAAGLMQATQAGESINALALSIDESAQAAFQIAASSQQQLVGMDQIAMAIGNIQLATTQNMTGTRQLEASAKSLQDLGGRLKVLVEQQRDGT